MRETCFAAAALLAACGPLTAGQPDPDAMLGKPAPGWESVTGWINLPEGKQALDVADYRGKVLVLVFYQKSCKGSREHMLPFVKQLADHCAGNKAVAFVAIQAAFKDFDVNTPAAVPEVAESLGLTFPMGHAGQEGQLPGVLMRYQAKGTPWLILIDTRGTIRLSGYRFTGQELVEKINELLAKAAEEPGTEQKPPAPPPEPKPEPLSPEAEALQKQLGQVRKRFEAVISDEMGSRARIMEARQKATRVVKDQDEAARKLGKGQSTKKLRAYAALLVACLRQLRALDAKFAAVSSTVYRLRQNPAAKEVEDDFDALAKAIEKRRINLLDQMAECCVKAGRLDEAVKIYSRLRDLVPAKDKDMRRAYAEKTAGAYETYEQWNQALDIYVRIYENLPEEKRKADINLRIKLGNLYGQSGDIRKALETFKAVKKDLKPGQDIPGLDEHIRKLEQRL